MHSVVWKEVKMLMDRMKQRSWKGIDIGGRLKKSGKEKGYLSSTCS